MKIVLLHVSSAREDWADEACAIYTKKISAFFPCAEEALKPKKISREDAAFKKAADSETLLAALKPDDFVLLWDEKGKSFDSRAFAKQFENILGRSKKRLVMVIGGAYGVDESLKKRAELTVSFGPMTMNHLLAKTAVLEQTYRALTILRGLPYHND